MIRHERDLKLMSLLDERPVLTIEEICEELFISESTARRDIARLNALGAVTRVYGGVAAKTMIANDTIPFLRREKLNEESKKIIAKKASKFVKDGDVLILDGSTSAHYILPNLLHFKDLIIFTSNCKTATLACDYNIKTFVTGGQMLPGSYSFIGHDAERMAAIINADIMFFSCRGISPDGMLTDPSVEENSIRQVMLRRAQKKILLCDSSKIGRMYFHNLCHVNEIDEIVCETELPQFLKNIMHNPQHKE